MAHDRQTVSDTDTAWPDAPCVVGRVVRWFPARGYGFAHTADFGDVFISAAMLPADPTVGTVLRLRLHVDRRGRLYGVQAPTDPV